MSSKSTNTGQESGGRLSDQVYIDLKQDIIRAVLAPGTSLSESLLGQRYSVGKAPIRSALSRLSHEGLVVAVPRSGHVVSAITIRDVIDLYEAHTIVEPAAAGLAAGNVDQDVLELAAAACEFSFSADNPDEVARYLKVNSDFHLLVARYSGNQRLVTMISSVLEATERVRHIAAIGGAVPATSTSDQHRTLIKALVDGDAERAASTAESHIKLGWKNIMGALFSQNRVYDQEVTISRPDGGSTRGNGLAADDLSAARPMRGGLELRNVYPLKKQTKA